MALQDLRNDIKAGKKIFEVFEKAEAAVNQILSNQAQYDELETAIENRKKELDSLSEKAISINGQLEAALQAGVENLDATNAKCKDIESEAKQKAERVIEKAKEEAEKIAFDTSTAEFKLKELESEVKAMDKNLEAKSKELAEVNAKIDAAKKAMADAIKGL